MLLGTCSRAVVRCVLCAYFGFAAPGGRCCLAPVRVPWLWPAACLSGVPRGPACCAAPRPVRLLSVLRSAFPTPWCLSPPRGLAPPTLLGGCAGHVEAGRESGSLCLPLAPAEAGGLGSLRVVPVRGPSMGLSLAGPSGIGLGLRALRWLACVEPVTDASRFPYRPSFNGGLGRCTGAVSCGRQHLPLRLGECHARVPCVCACARLSWPGRAGRPARCVLVRLTFCSGCSPSPPPYFFYLFLLPRAPFVSGFLWFPAPGALSFDAVCCLFCWPPASRLSVRLRLFCVSCLAIGCSLVVAAPPPPFVCRGLCCCRSVLCFSLALCVVRFVGLPLLGSLCPLASFVFPAWLLAAPWWMLPPPPLCLAVFVAAAWCLVFFSSSFVVRPRCLWFSLVFGPGYPEPWRCVLFALLASRFSALRALLPLLFFPPRRCLLPAGCCPPPPLCLAVFIAAARCSGFFFLSSVVRPRCLWLSLVSGHVCPGPWCCVLFVLLASRFSARCALSPLLCFPPGRWVLPGGCCPPPPLCVSRFSSLPLGARFFFSSSSVVCPRCLWLSLGSGPGYPRPWRCVLFVLLASRFSALCALSPLLCFPPGRWLVPGGCCPPSLLRLAVFLAAAPCSVFFHSAALLLPACLALVGGSRRLLPPPPPRCVCGALCCLVLPRCAALPSGVLWCRVAVFRAACRAVVPCLAVLWAAGRCAVFVGVFVCVLCCAVGCCCVLCRVFGRAVPLGCSRCGLLSGFGLRCRVPCCAVCPWVRCCAALLRVVPPGVVLLCAVLFCCARLMPLLVVPCPLALHVALGPCALRRCVMRCFPALCALCCVCSGVACWCLLLFAAVLCAVCVLGCRAVRSLSCPLCAVLCFAVLVCLRCAVRVVRAVVGAWCSGVLLCVVLFPLGFCGAVLDLVARGCLLVVCFGVGVPVWPRGLVFCGWCGLLWCPASLCRVLLCSAVGLRCCLCLLCPPVASPAVLCCAVGCLCCFVPSGGVCVLWCPFPPCRHPQTH